MTIAEWRMFQRKFDIFPYYRRARAIAPIRIPAIPRPMPVIHNMKDLLASLSIALILSWSSSVIFAEVAISCLTLFRSFVN